MGIKQITRFRKAERSDATPAASVIDTSKNALYSCLKRVKITKDQTETKRLTEELQRIVFHKQYWNADVSHAGASLLRKLV